MEKSPSFPIPTNPRELLDDLLAEAIFFYLVSTMNRYALGYILAAGLTLFAVALIFCRGRRKERCSLAGLVWITTGYGLVYWTLLAFGQPVLFQLHPLWHVAAGLSVAGVAMLAVRKLSPPGANLQPVWALLQGLTVLSVCFTSAFAASANASMPTPPRLSATPTPTARAGSFPPQPTPGISPQARPTRSSATPSPTPTASPTPTQITPTSPPDLPAAPKALPTPLCAQGRAAIPRGRKYIVQHGDNLVCIAFQSGISLEMLLKANPEQARRPNNIWPGEVLRIP